MSNRDAYNLERSVYGDFELTDAIRPGFGVPVVPTEGYRTDRFKNRDVDTAVLVAAVSRQRLFDVFMDSLREYLPGEVGVVLETSHETNNNGHVDLYREGIDLPVLQSHAYDFEDLLMNDGCTGIAVLGEGTGREIQFDDHKLLIAYGDDLRVLQKVLAGYGVRQNQRMRMITEAEHLHSTSKKYELQFAELARRLGVGKFQPEPDDRDDDMHAS